MKAIYSLALILLTTEAISININNHNSQGNKPGEAATFGIDPESFAEASVQARIDADLELELKRGSLKKIPQQ